MPKILPTTFALLVFSLAALSAHARNLVYESLEWMTVDAPLIVRASVTDFKDTPGPGEVFYRDLNLKVHSTLKGKPAEKNLSIRLRLYSGYTQGEAWKKSGKPLLFFLVPGKAETDSDLGDHWTLRDLDKSVVDPNDPAKLYTMQMAHPKSADEILATIKKWATWQPPLKPTGNPVNRSDGQHNYVLLELDINGGYIIIPATEEFRASALKQAASKETYERANGAEMLKNYPGPETLDLLTKLLNDAGMYQGASSQSLVNITYPVRQAAYDSLLELGKNPEKPICERKPTNEEIAQYTEHEWRASLTEALPKEWTTLSVTAIPNPAHWQSEKPSADTIVQCQRPATLAQPAATFQLFIMPKEWQGRDIANTQIVNKDGYTRLNKDPEAADTARYLGRSDPFLYFIAGSPEMDTRLSHYFGITH